jgi:hypothetical protein
MNESVFETNKQAAQSETGYGEFADGRLLDRCAAWFGTRLLSF